VVEIGDSASVVIRRASGAAETYTIPWRNSGTPRTSVPSLPDWKLARDSARRRSFEEMYREMTTWSVPDKDPLLETVTDEGTGETHPRHYWLGVGQSTPWFGIPEEFVQRLGRSRLDFL
jgi:hypothetical protein